MLQLLPRVEEGFASLISYSTQEKAGYFQRNPTWEASKEGEEDTVNSTVSRGHPSLSLSPSWTLRAPWGQKPYPQSFLPLGIVRTSVEQFTHLPSVHLQISTKYLTLPSPLSSLVELLTVSAPATAASQIFMGAILP